MVRRLSPMIEGLPAGVHITTEDIVGALARRRLGYGRGARMKFEQDKVRMLTGVRFGETIGSPVAIEIANTEWPKWTEVMSADRLIMSLLVRAAMPVVSPASGACGFDWHA